jgi:integral membrane protein
MDGNSSLKQLRVVGYLEGVSFLLLLFVAMPVKYALDEPLLVRIVGAAHGALFLAYLYLLVRTAVERGWPASRAFVGFVASVVPFAVFFFDRTLRSEVSEASRADESVSPAP